MKKPIAILLAMVMCLSFVACGSSEFTNSSDFTDIEEDLYHSVWFEFEIYGDYQNGISWFFDENKMSASKNENGETKVHETGAYKVTDKCIEIDWDNENVSFADTIYYSTETGVLKLYSDSEMKNPFVRALTNGLGDDKEPATYHSIAPSTTIQTTLATISEEKIERLAKQEIENACFKDFNVEKINIKYGTFEIENKNNGYIYVYAKGTYYPIDSFGEYQRKRKFDITIQMYRDGSGVQVYKSDFSYAY